MKRYQIAYPAMMNPPSRSATMKIAPPAAT
jgi:hypothetical protein